MLSRHLGAPGVGGSVRCRCVAGSWAARSAAGCGAALVLV